MEAHAIELARRLRHRGHDARIVELGVPLSEARQDGTQDRVPVVTLGLDEGRPEKVGLLAWYRALRSLHCDVLVFEKGSVTMGSVALDLAARASARRYITIEQVDPPPKPPRRTGRHLGGLLPGLGLWWYRLVGGTYLRSLSPHKVVTVSRAALRVLRSYGFPARKMVVVPNGVDPSRFRPDRALRSATRASWGAPLETIVFGTVGRLAAWHKGQDSALELLAQLRRARPAVKFVYVLVGEGDDRQRLEDMARSIGLSERVLFAGAATRPWEAYNAIDILLMPSRFEGTPFALLEAMACGCCAIAMGVGGIPEVISSPELGWLVPPGDRDGFMQAMEAALDVDPPHRQAMGERARRHVEEHFQADRQYDKLLDLIELP